MTCKFASSDSSTYDSRTHMTDACSVGFVPQDVRSLLYPVEHQSKLIDHMLCSSQTTFAACVLAAQCYQLYRQAIYVS